MKLVPIFTFLVLIQFTAGAYTFQRDSILTGSNAHRYIPNSQLVRLYANTNIPAYVQWQQGSSITKDQAFGYIRKWGSWEENMKLELIGTETDELGFIHERYQQTLNGYPILGGIYILHIRQGMVESMNGLLYAQVSFSSPTISEQTAFENAKRSMQASIFKWEIPAEEAHLKEEQNNPKATYFPTAQKVIIPQDLDFYHIQPTFVTCYAFDLYAHEPIDRKKVYVNAQNGKIEYQEALLKHATNHLGTAKTAYSDTQFIRTDSTSPVTYRLRETFRGLGVETWNLQKGTSYAAAVDFIDSNNFWNNVNANKDEYATDAHWGLEKSWDYYWFKHNRNSINGAGFKLLNYIHYSTNYTNAFWDGSRMTYGDGAAPYTPLVAMDIVAHEITHGLTEFTSNLVYSYESGALNESFSDIFGVSVDFYSRPSQANYLMGDGIGGTPFRSMQNPNLYNDPDTYLGTSWYAGAADNGGVHTNSGVQNFWYYLMVNGGTGTNDLGNPYTVVGMGFDTAGKIAFRNNTVYLTAASQYADARFYAIQSAADLYGMCTEPVKQTANAWHAVGVGPKFDTTLSLAFTATPTSNCLVPSSHKFINTSSVASYQWYFGDGGTSTLPNPTYVYNTTGSFTVKLVATCGIKKDSLIKVNYINITPAVPVVFNRTPDTTICEKTTINLKANTNIGAPTWLFNGAADSQMTVTPKANTIYRFSRNNSCQTFYDSIKVSVVKTPTVNTATAAFPTVCQGNIDTVKATGSLRVDQILQLGTGTAGTSTNGNTPYNRTWEGNRTQWIIRASELTALGATAGPIRSLQFNVTASGSGTNHQKNFTIKMAHTAQTAMASAWATITGTWTQVYGPTTVPNPPTGWNNYFFNHPFEWDGTSNIIIEICHDNDINNSCAACYSPNAAVQYSTLTYNAVYSNFSDDAQRCGTSGGTTTGYTTTRRPNMRFGFYPLQSNTAGISWNWTPGNITSANAVVNPNTIPVTSYKVYANTPTTTCVDSASLNINVVAKPTLMAAADTTICAGSGAYLKATATGGTVNWIPGGMTGTNVLVNPSSTTTYIAFIDNGTCVVYDTMVVTVIPIPTLTARTDTSICAGQSVQLTAVSNIAPITWNPGGMTGSSVMVTPAGTTDYIASVNNACGTKLDTVKITAIPIPTIAARADTSICNGQSVTLYATANISPITWNPGALVGNNKIVNPNTTTTYIGNVSNVCGSKNDTVIITVIPIPTLTARTDTSICNGNTINLTAVSNIAPINWNPGGLTGSSVFVSPSASTLYIATTSNACGTAIDSVNINVIPLPTLVARTDTGICSGNSVLLQATTNASPITWNPGNLIGSNVLVAPSTTTLYIASASNACGTKLDSVLINVTPTPTIAARNDTGICSGQFVTLYASSNISPITWNPGGFTGSNLIMNPTTTTTYIASVNNSCGSKNDTVVVTVTPIPSLLARTDTAICQGASVALTATSNISPITWTPGSMVGSPVNVTPSVTTSYIAMVVNVCAVKRDTVVINVIPQPTLTARADTTICSGASVPFYATTNIATVNWFFPPSTVLNGNGFLRIINDSTPVYVSVTNACNTKSDTVNIFVNKKPNLIARADTTICEGNSILLSSTSNSPVTWNPGNINGFNVNVNPILSTNYIASSTNLCGTSLDTVVISVIEKPTVVGMKDTTICTGSPIKLFGYSSLSITWNPGNLANLSTVNPTSTTQYIAQVNNVCGIGKDTVAVTVIPQPTINATADTVICPNTNTQLQAVSNASIIWNPGNVSGNALNINITNSQNYIATATNLCGSKNDTVAVTVLPIPTVTARTDTSICYGGTLQLFANSNINQYVWTPGNNTNASFAIAPTQSTDYIVQSSNKCGIAKDTVKVNVLPLPFAKLGNDTFVCKGNAIKIIAQGNGTFNWNIGGTDSFIVESPVIASSYSVTVSNSCGQAVDYILIDVVQKPIAKATFTKIGNKVSFFNESTYGKKFIWNFGDGKSDTSTDAQHTYTANTIVKPQLIAMNDCGNDTFNMNISLSALSAIEGTGIVVYPIPTKDYLFIETEHLDQIESVSLYNAIGQQMDMKTEQIDKGIRLQTAALPAGMYMIHLKINGIWYNHQVTKSE